MTYKNPQRSNIYQVERLALIGVSHRRGGAAALEAWQNRFETPDFQRLGLQEWVPLVTCNRWELITVLPEGMNVAEARARLTPPGQSVRPYAFVGDGALEQLSRVAASLDSLNPGEDQIMAQVRSAFSAAQALGTTGKTTVFAFHTALRIAKKVRRDIDLAPLHTSLFSLARPQLERSLAPGDRVAVLGAGEMGTLAAKSLAENKNVQLTIVNRTPERAAQLGKHLGVESLSLAEFLAAPPPLDALVCALSAGDVVDERVLEKLPSLKTIVDLGVPRNLKAGAARGLCVLDVDTLQAAGQLRRTELTDKLARAERLIQGELELALTEWTERQLGPSIKKLRDWYLDTIGDSLPAADAAKLAHKFAHVPVKGLRAVARAYGLGAAKVFLDETGLNDEVE